MAKTTETTKVEKTETETKATALTYYYAVGRRREAAARIRLYVCNEENLTIAGKTHKKGDIEVNGRTVATYFPGEVSQKIYLEPLRTTNALNRFVITAKVEGGGPQGQLGAVIHGISRALVKVDPEKNKPILRKRGFLTRDPRAKQRRKAGYAQKARKKKQSPKR